MKRAATIVLLALLASCESQQGVDSPQMPDLPVPDGMTLQSRLSESHSYEVSGYRNADLNYFGNVPVAEVATYMKERMKLHDWSLVDEESGEERCDLQFDRPPYETTCEIWQDAAAVTRMRVKLRTRAGR